MVYREENGAFQSRAELKKVPKLGPKAFEQCAGFLRVPESKNVLDNTAGDPESYEAAKGPVSYTHLFLMREPDPPIPGGRLQTTVLSGCSKPGGCRRQSEYPPAYFCRSPPGRYQYELPLIHI